MAIGSFHIDYTHCADCNWTDIREDCHVRGLPSFNLAFPSSKKLRKRESRPNWEHSTPVFCLAGDWIFVGMLTNNAPACRPQYFGNSLAFGRSASTVKASERGARWRHGRIFDIKSVRFMSKCSLLTLCNKFKKIRKNSYSKNINYTRRFPVSWRQSRHGQVWHRLVQLGSKVEQGVKQIWICSSDTTIYLSYCNSFLLISYWWHYPFNFSMSKF